MGQMWYEGFAIPRKPPSAHIWRKDIMKPAPVLSVIMSVRSRSAGATMVRDTAPAIPPASSRCKGCLGGVIHNLQAPSYHQILKHHQRTSKAQGKAVHDDCNSAKSEESRWGTVKHALFMLAGNSYLPSLAVVLQAITHDVPSPKATMHSNAACSENLL